MAHRDPSLSWLIRVVLVGTISAQNILIQMLFPSTSFPHAMFQLSTYLSLNVQTDRRLSMVTLLVMSALNVESGLSSNMMYVINALHLCEGPCSCEHTEAMYHTSGVSCDIYISHFIPDELCYSLWYVQGFLGRSRLSFG